MHYIKKIDIFNIYLPKDGYAKQKLLGIYRVFFQ